MMVLVACQPGETQPVFTSAYGTETPIPLSTAKPKMAGTLPGRIRSFNISADMKTIAFATSQGVVLYDLKSYKYLQTMNEAESFCLVQWSPDGKNWRRAVWFLVIQNLVNLISLSGMRLRGRERLNNQVTMAPWMQSIGILPGHQIVVPWQPT
jgi:hypothetical protein